MKQQQSKKPPAVRKNVSLQPEVDKILKRLAKSEFTSASALVTRWTLEYAKEKHPQLLEDLPPETKQDAG